MGYDIQSAGVATIFTATAGSTTTVGPWKRVHHDVTRMAFAVTLGTASAGATATSSGVLEVSHDGVTPIASKAQSFQLAGTTDLVADGAVYASSMNGAWPYVRYNMQLLSSSTAGSAGSPSLVVTAAPGWRT